MMKQKKRLFKFLSVLLLTLVAWPIMGMSSDTICSRLTFCMDSSLSLSIPEASVTAFISAIHALEAGEDTVVTIVHLGDSHIQAGFLTGKVMRLLQQVYGNAGRGWIAPFKLSKTNEPFDYFINSPVKEWTAGRVTQSLKKAPVGPGGIGLQTAVSDVRLQVGVTPKNGAGYSFNELIAYRDARSMPMEVVGRLTDFTRICYSASPVVPGVLTDTFHINCLTDTLALRSTRIDPRTGVRSSSGDFKNIYYGFSMLNNNPGILYHSVGVNGAMFINYCDNAFMERLSLLKPSLLIVSLGTNETFGRRFNEAEFAAQIDTFLTLVKEYIPATSVLLTTPPECYRPVTVNKKREYVRNEKTSVAARTIVRIAQQKEVACWDLFSFTGGENSCHQWFKGKWMGKDRVHFTWEGYEEQGILFYRAIQKLIESGQPVDTN